MCSQKKETKENATPLPLYPSVLAPHLGRLRNSPSDFIRAQTVLATYHLPLKPNARQRGGKAMRPRGELLINHYHEMLHHNVCI